MAKLRVLMVGPIKAAQGGIHTLMRDLAAGPLRDAFDLRTFDNSKRTARGRWLVTGLLSQGRILCRYAIELLRCRPDVVHIHFGGHPDIFRKSIDALLACMVGSQVILHSHSGDFAESLCAYGPTARGWIRWIMRRCRRVVVMSEDMHEQLSAMLPGVDMAVVPNGLRGSEFAELPAREAARTALDIAGGRPLIASVGRMGVAKGMFDLVEVAAMLRERYSGAVWIAAGPDDQLEAGATDRMSERIGELGLADVVRLPGLIDTSTRNKLLAAADVFLLPSHGENFPMVVLEAMAAGLPIVATRVGAVPEMTAHGETGLLVEPKNPEAIAEAVCELLDAPERAATLGRRAKRRFEELYEVDGPISKMWAELYNVMAGAK